LRLAVAAAVATCTCIIILARRCPEGVPGEYLPVVLVLDSGGEIMPYPVVRHIPGQEGVGLLQPGYAEGAYAGPAGAIGSYTPLESIYDLVNIPGTSLYVGTITRVIQTWTGEIVTRTERYGQLLGCDHMVYNIHEYATAFGLYRGVGGRCPYCTAEAAALFSENQITLRQAEAKSLFCSRCSRSCRACGRSSLCARHAGLVAAPDGSSVSLCVDCLASMKRQRLWNTIVAILLAPFVDHNRPSGPGS
jgi:hypothetical protein